MIPLLLVWALAADAPDAAARARVAEEQAFAAIERKEWCVATNLFLKANTAAPSGDFLMNAAMAAEYASDRTQALALYAQVIADKGSRAAEAKKRATALAAVAKKDGPGAACAPPPPDPPEPKPEPPPAVEPPGAEPPPAAAEPGVPVAAIALIAGGGAALLGGGALLGVGAVPWFQHGSAASALRTAEADRSDNEAALSTLQTEQSAARAAWEGWGRFVVVAGAAAVGVGLVAAAAGGALFFVEAE